MKTLRQIALITLLVTFLFSLGGCDESNSDTEPVISQFQEKAILHGNGQYQQYYGSNISSSGDTVIISAYGTNTSSGTTYIYRQNGTSWNQEALLMASVPQQAYAYFGKSISIFENFAIIGASGEDTAALAGGAAYIFFRSETNWWPVVILDRGDDAQIDDNFGYSVSINNTYVVVGKLGSFSNYGTVYIYRIGSWDNGIFFSSLPLDAHDNFGASVSISKNNIIVVGASFWGPENSGAVYVYRLFGITWRNTEILDVSMPSTFRFGANICINGDLLIVSANNAVYIYRDNGTNFIEEAIINISDASSVSISDNYAIVGVPTTESVYVYSRNGINWSEEIILHASDAQADDKFGSSVSISGNSIFVGASWKDTGNDYAGAVYIFEK